MIAKRIPVWQVEGTGSGGRLIDGTTAMLERVYSMAWMVARQFAPTDDDAAENCAKRDAREAPDSALRPTPRVLPKRC